LAKQKPSFIDNKFSRDTSASRATPPHAALNSQPGKRFQTHLRHHLEAPPFTEQTDSGKYLQMRMPERTATGGKKVFMPTFRTVTLAKPCCKVPPSS